MVDIAELSWLALAIWQHGLRRRGAGPFVIAARVERAIGQSVSPAAVSAECRALVREGFADRSAFGYRERQVQQMELVR